MREKRETQLSMDYLWSNKQWSRDIDYIHVLVRSRLHEDVMTWKRFPYYWPFVRGIHCSERIHNAQLWWFCRHKQSVSNRTVEMQVICDAMTIMRCHRSCEFPAQRPVTRSFDVFFDLNKRLSKQWWGWWFETLSLPLWRHNNGQDNLHNGCRYLASLQGLMLTRWTQVNRLRR